MRNLTPRKCRQVADSVDIEHIVNTLAALPPGGVNSAVLARAAYGNPGLSLVVKSAVRRELLDLERLGIVYRTGQTKGTRWFLG